MLSDEKKKAIQAAAEQWLRTPFRQHAEIVGVVADCVHLAPGVLVTAGFVLPPITIADYPRDWGQHCDRSLVVEWLESSGCFTRLPDGAALQPGDVLCIKQGRSSHHVVVVVNDRFFIHTAVGRFAFYGMLNAYGDDAPVEHNYRHHDAQ